MLEILNRDGSCDLKNGRIKFYESTYDYKIEDENGYRVENLKLVYDTETKEGVYYTYSAMQFFDANKYEEYYDKSIHEIQLEHKFKEYIEIFLEVPKLEIDEIPEWLASFKDDILNIYNGCA